MFARHIAAALGVFGLVGLALAQENGRDFLPEAVPNWTAPPYWSPTETRERSLPDVAGRGTDRELAPMGALPSTPLPLTAVNPCRIVDTRGAAGPFGGPALVANATRTFNLPSGPCAGIPADAEAYSLNLTIIGTSGLNGGFLTAWPTGSAQPTVSTLNFNATELVANAAVVPAGTSGSINVLVNIPGHLLIDINGYYQAIPLVNTVNGLFGAVTLAPGTNISITPAGNTLTIANTASAPAAWQLTGNAGSVPGTNFVGTTDAQALELRVNGGRALRIEPQGANAPNLIGGHPANSVTATAYAATIGGGGGPVSTNRVTDVGGTVAGGVGNRAGDNAGSVNDRIYATVGGGLNNTASASSGTVAGGNGNTAGGTTSSTVSGGISNTASGESAAIGGGEFNTASGDMATVPGGYNNTAAGSLSFAAGRQVVANHAGTFVWGDTTFADPPMASTGVNQFIVRSAGGIWFGTTSTPSFNIATDFLRTSTGAHLTIGGVWTDNSDVNSKENFQDVDRRDVLSRVVSLPITRWNYKAEDCEVEHLGPMAQDFSAAFGLGGDDHSIATLDSAGVALAAIQGLYEIVKEKDAEIEALKLRLSKLEAKFP